MSVRFESQAEPITGYRLIERLGSGGFGEVWKAEAPGGIFKAIKIIHGDLRNRENDTYRFAEQELKALKRVKQVRHPYLLALDRYDIIDGRLLITMELADCNLWDRFRQCRKQGMPGIPREELLRYMSETAEVLDLFNDKFQLQHLDIKPQNLFLLYDHVKVADFGQVKDLEGLMAQVTGGITPVYAAPETFDGFVSRFCDQYSLACVYQELLTGHRPFDGNSMQQLLMQHLQLPPNLQPSPVADRAVLNRALSKKPDDRFPNVMNFVTALRQGDTTPKVSVPVPATPTGSTNFQYAPPNQESNQPSDQIRVSWPSTGTGGAGSSTSEGPRDATGFPANIPVGGPKPNYTPLPFNMYESQVVPEREAPAEILGNGSLRPTLIIGLGYTGLRVLQRFKKQIQDRFISTTQLPSVRMLYLDTDPETPAMAADEQPWNGLAALSNDMVFNAKLNRASHYLKPQSSIVSRTPLEEWFDIQLLYRLPRIPATLGLRPLGRLAFSDHYRNLHQKISAELEQCIDPHAIADTQVHTGVEFASNHPRVYIVAGLAGGTGSGMFIDISYLVRYRLKRLGYSNPDVVGLFTVPPESSPKELTAQAQANTYAALTELFHYSQEDTSYLVNFDERFGGLRDDSPPFREIYLQLGLASPPNSQHVANGNVTQTRMPGSGMASYNRPNAGSGPRSFPRRNSSGAAQTPNPMHPNRGTKSGMVDLSGDDPTSSLVDLLRVQLFSGVGKHLESQRDANEPPSRDVLVRTFGCKKFVWPRSLVVERVARIVAPVLLSQWFAPDPEYSRTVVPAWIQDQWTRVPLDPDLLGTMLLEKANQKLDHDPLEVCCQLLNSLNPRGWLQRMPEPEQMSVALARCQEEIGQPNTTGQHGTSFLEERLLQTVLDYRPTLQSEVGQLFVMLVENPQFRLAGAEEAVRQMHSQLERTKTKLTKRVNELVNQAHTAYQLLLVQAKGNRANRKISSAEFADALKNYPVAQHQYRVLQAVIQVINPLRDQLACLLLEIGGCRQRIESIHPKLLATAEQPALMGTPGELLPAGCNTPEDAAQLFVKCLNDDDLQALDRHVQAGLEQVFGGLYEAGLNCASGDQKLLTLIRDQTRSYLDQRLGEVDLAGMLAQRFPTRQKAIRAIAEAYEEAKPKLISGGPWARNAIEIFAVPFGDGGAPIQELGQSCLPPEVQQVPIDDEIYIHRELQNVPISALPQLGPAWSAAYRSAPEGMQFPPHARIDVTEWADIDGS